MPLTTKGSKIMGNMEKEYGPEAERVFYAARNAGTIAGVDAARMDEMIGKVNELAARADASTKGLSVSQVVRALNNNGSPLRESLVKSMTYDGEDRSNPDRPASKYKMKFVGADHTGLIWVWDMGGILKASMVT